MAHIVDITNGPGFYNMDCMKAMREFPDKFTDNVWDLINN